MFVEEDESVSVAASGDENGGLRVWDMKQNVCVTVSKS
jgi:hypothetical protein